MAEALQESGQDSAHESSRECIARTGRAGYHRTLGFGIAATIFFLDQAAKWAVTHIFQLRQRGTIELLPIFDLKWVENRGVSMGFLTADSAMETWLLVALTGAMTILIIALLWREKRRHDVIALAFVLGGAFGNILDRVRFGYVVDYADLHFGDIHPFLVFNVSDAAITIGVLLYALSLFLPRRLPVVRQQRAEQQS